MHVLQSLAPYYAALSRGVEPADLRLAGPDGAAYVQCLGPQEVTDAGMVVFRIAADEQEVRWHDPTSCCHWLWLLGQESGA